MRNLWKDGTICWETWRPRTFANGNSSSRAEHFLRGGVSEQAEHWGANRLDRTYLTGGESESCCAHNTEKILEYLLRYDPEHRLQYLEHLESLKYNAVLNAFSGKTGLSQYHQPMGADSRKKFSSPYGDFWCCTGSGVEAAAELQKNIWFEEKGRIFLNMFVSSELHLEEPKATLCLQSEFPKKPGACLQVETDQAVSLELAFRQSGVKNVQAHGAVCETSCEDGFLVVTGTFGEGSFLELELQAEIREVPLGKEKEIYCLKYGPVLLAEIAGTYVRKEPLCLNSEGDFTGRDCVFRPLYLVEEETYTVYLNSGESTEAKDGSSAYA